LRVRGRAKGRTRGTTPAGDETSTAATLSKRVSSRRTNGGRFRGSSAGSSADDDDQTSAGSIQSRVATKLKPSNRLGLAAGAGSSSSKSLDKKKKLVCYYTNWSQYRPKIGKFIPEDIPADLCTHLIFSFGWMKKGKLSSFETNDESKDGKVGLYEKINNLKKVNPELKTLLAIGGWSFGTQKFKEMSATRYSRQIFVFSAIPYLRERDFDGLDIDWEYPKGTDDKKNYVLLLKGNLRLQYKWLIHFNKILKISRLHCVTS
jgi:chitinase